MAAPNVHQSFAVRARPEDVRFRLIPAAATDGYAFAGELPNGFAVRRRRIPVWAIVLAVIFFPLGLLFLLVKADEIVTVALANVYGGTQVTITGRASGALQRALQVALAVYQPAGAEPAHAGAVAPQAVEALEAHPPPPPPSQPEAPSEAPPAPVAMPAQPSPVPLPTPAGFPGGGLLGGLPGGGLPGGLAGGGPPGGLPPMPFGAPPPPPAPAELPASPAEESRPPAAATSPEDSH